MHIFKSKETMYSSKFRDIYFIENTRTGYMQEDRLWILLWGTICVKTQNQIQPWKCNIFDLGAEIIKENCDFKYYFNNSDVIPAVLDGGHEIVLANWPNNKHVICNDNNNIPVKIPSHPYVLINITVLCKCRIKVEDNFLLESRVACPGKQSDLNMCFTVNTAFMHYIDSSTTSLETYVSQNWTTQEQVLPISLQTFDFDSKLLEAPKTLKDFAYQCQQKNQVLDKRKTNDNSKHSFFDNYLMDVFLFISTILSIIATAAIVCIACKYEKVKALLIGIAFQPIRQTDALFGNENEHCTYIVQWYILTPLASMIIDLIIFILPTTRKWRIFRGKLFFNTVTVLLFFSDVKQYVPVKICKTTGSIHLFKNLWTTNPRSNYAGKKIIVGCTEDRVERSLYAFEWNYNTFTNICHNSIWA